MSRRARDELRRANELHHRAEVQRRAMMSRAERQEADYVLEVERAQRQGRKSAGERACLVGLVGFFAAIIIAGAVWEWLFLPVLAGAVWLARYVFKLRMGELNVELSNMPVPWDKNPS